jgi:hypothetical protein
MGKVEREIRKADRAERERSNEVQEGGNFYHANLSTWLITSDMAAVSAPPRRRDSWRWER